jgi:hypothetical protein
VTRRILVEENTVLFAAVRKLIYMQDAQHCSPNTTIEPANLDKQHRPRSFIIYETTDYFTSLFNDTVLNAEIIYRRMSNS